MAKSDLPFGSEFTPTTMSLAHLLRLAAEHHGNRSGLRDAILAAYFAQHATSETNKRKLAGNTLISMAAYGLLDSAVELTPLGRELLEWADTEQEMHIRLARHILLHLHGLNLVQCIEDMQASGQDVTLETLRPALAQRGVLFPSGGKHPSVMRLWLEKAGVFVGGWRVDPVAVQRTLGLAPAEIEAFARLTPEQRSFLRTLARTGGIAQPSNEISRLAAFVDGTEFREKSLPATVLYPLEQAGFITLERGTREPGRGARPFTVCITDKMSREVIEPLFEQFAGRMEAGLRELLRRPLGEILASLEGEDRHQRGLALEALAFKLMRLVDLKYVHTRLRGAATGGAEVDVLFEATRPAFARWQIQCKNTARVALDDLAKEVGLTVLLKTNVVAIVSTGEIGSEARRYANQIMRDTHLAVVLLDRADLERLCEAPSAIVELLQRESTHAAQIKKLPE
jgi:site-specific DNA-methyltransferase (cytosine-N4-specific)